MSAPDLESTQAIIPYLWTSIGAAFLTMGSGFVYLLGVSKESAASSASILDRVEETHELIAAHALDDARRYVERGDLAGIEGRIMGRLDGLATRIETIGSRVHDVANAVAVIQGRNEFRDIHGKS